MKILIGISGCIAAYKICSLINKIKKNNNYCKVILSEGGSQFITPLTIETLSNEPVYTDQFIKKNFQGIEHIDLADWCDVMLVAPATYNTINKIACGVADNLLTTVVSAIPESTPVYLAPAMNCHMWENPIIQENIKKLSNLKNSKKVSRYRFIKPKKGHLACGYEGEGVLADIDNIYKTLIGGKI